MKLESLDGICRFEMRDNERNNHISSSAMDQHDAFVLMTKTGVP